MIAIFVFWNYTQNEVIWEFDFLQTNGFEYMPMEKWFNFSQIHMPILHRYHFGIGIDTVSLDRSCMCQTKTQK